MAERNVLITEPVEIISQEGEKCTGTVIFLHGSGDTGPGVLEWVKSLHKFSFPHLRVLFPTAPLRPYTPNDGMPSNVWFDRLRITPNAPEHMETTDATAKELVNIVKDEVKRGVPLHRIAIGGFSMGGAMSFHLGYRYLTGIAGVFALSSFLGKSSAVYKALENEKPAKIPSLLMCHGTDDSLIWEQWSKQTYESLSKHGVPVEYHVFPNVAHELDRKELHLLHSWLLQKIPEQESFL